MPNKFVFIYVNLGNVIHSISNILLVLIFKETAKIQTKFVCILVVSLKIMNSNFVCIGVVSLKIRNSIFVCILAVSLKIRNPRYKLSL